MNNNNKYYFFTIILIALNLLTNNNSFAEIKENTFLSLRASEVNVRQGPDWSYPIKFVYKKKYLPVLLIDSFEIWRKVKDHQNNVGWIHISKLSKKKSAINIKDYSIVFEKPTIYSKPLFKLETGRLLLIKKCKKDWCKVTTSNYSGWIKKEFLWGRI